MDKAPTTNQSSSELELHLREQLGFLESSAERFDQGIESEAKRLAHTLRLLLHDTKSSKSLLGQLNLKQNKFHNSLCPETPNNKLTYSGLTSQFIGPNPRYIPHLDDIPPSFIRKTNFDDWWNEVIVRDANGSIFCRKDVVLHLANTDGGSHVDPTIENEYADFSRNNSLGWNASEGSKSRPLAHPELSTVRQIAHEILKTLVPNYSKSRNIREPGIVMLSAGLNVGMSIPMPAHSAHMNRKIGRNDRCPCGSGKKYKHCHGG